MLPAVAVLAMLFGAPTATAASDAPWRGFLWPVKAERDFQLSLGLHATLDACRRTAMIHILAAGWRDGADWECGLNCKRREDPGNAWHCEDRTR